MLVNSIFFFSQNIFQRQQQSLTLSQTSHSFYMSSAQVFRKHCGTRRNCSYRAISPFPSLFFACLDNFLPFSSNIKLSYANSLSLEEFKTLLFNKQLSHYHMMLHFDTLKIYSCGKHLRRGEIACNNQFLPYLQCFLPYIALIFRFKCTLKCHLQFASI